jgi:hypothetical protein
MKEKNFKYNIKKGIDEINLYYNIRKEFIILSNPKSDKEFKLYEMYSHILIDIVFLKCRYEKKTEKYIKDFMAMHKNKIISNIKLNI